MVDVYLTEKEEISGNLYHFDIEKVKTLIKQTLKEETCPDLIIFIFDGKHFVFDAESLKEFKEDFNNDFFIIFLENGYLCRRPKWDKDAKPKNFQYFHRYLLNEDRKDHIVHHITWCKRINIKGCLKPVTKKEHEDLHARRLHDTKYMKQSKWLEFID